jgi:tryptophan synthase beta subunit
MVVNLSGRGDKDIFNVASISGSRRKAAPPS